MAWRDSGNTPIGSTGGYSGASLNQGLLVNPSTSDIIAEIDSTQFQRVQAKGGTYLVTWVPGASTNAIWQLEQASSTDLSIAVRDLTYVQTPANQSGQYQLTYKLEVGDRLRGRVAAGFTGIATLKISAEPLT